MNFSSGNLLAARKRNGEPAEESERPSWVRDALAAERKVGWLEGKPIVPNPDGSDDGLRIGDDPTEAYSHVPTGEELLRPGAGSFLSKLRDRVDSLAEAAEETKADTETIRRSCRLHGVEPPEPNDEVDSDGADDGSEAFIRLPDGERVSTAILDSEEPYLDKLPLAIALSAGMGVGEYATWASREADRPITEHHVRDACRAANLLEGSGDSPGGRQGVAREHEVATAGEAEYDSEPW